MSDEEAVPDGLCHCCWLNGDREVLADGECADLCRVCERECQR